MHGGYPAGALTKCREQLYYLRQGKFEVDYVLELDGRIYAIEVKSDRKYRARGLEKLMSLFPDSIPLVITPDNCDVLLKADVVNEVHLSALVAA